MTFLSMLFAIDQKYKISYNNIYVGGGCSVCWELD